MGLLTGLASLLLLGCNALIVLALSKHTSLCVYNWPREAQVFVCAVAAAGLWMVALSSDDVIQPALFLNLSVFLTVVATHVLLNAEGFMHNLRLGALKRKKSASPIPAKLKAELKYEASTPLRIRHDELVSPPTPTTPVLPTDRNYGRRTSESERQEKARRYLAYAIKDDLCRKQYLEFAKQEFTSESVECLYARYLLQKKTSSSMPITELLQELQRFFDKFVAMDAPDQVNVSAQQVHKLKTRLDNALENPEAVDRSKIMTWVDDITNEVENLVLNDPFPRFMQSPYFQTFLHSVEAAKKMKPKLPAY